MTPALDPWGQPWRAVLMRKELALAKFREAAGGPVVDGRLVHRGIDPGVYTLDIRDSQGATSSPRTWSSIATELSSPPRSLWSSSKGM